MEGMTMNAAQMKIQKTSRVVSIITKILYVFLIIIISVEVIGVGWIAALPDSSLNLRNLPINFPAVFNGGASTKQMAFPLLVYAIEQTFVLFVLILTHKIFKDISREYTPFLEKNFKRMKKIALILLFSSLQPFSFGEPGSLNINIGPDYELLIFAGIVYFFALIFQYGSMLQQQSDETL
jgi:hypothetical protein